MYFLIFCSVTLLFISFPSSQSISLQNNIHSSVNSNYLETYGTGSAKHLPPNLSTPELIMRRGYPLERHDIITGDGYILVAFRIPYGKKSPANVGVGNKFPVFILHGGSQTSADWIINFEEDDCLPFVLANNGFDVWLGNLRGNMHSNRHLNLSYDQTKFWDFSIDEVAKYDIPSTIDYILAKTKRDKLHYIGFSLGSTSLFMTAASKPEYNKKIGINIAYAALVFRDPFQASLRRLTLSYFEKPLRLLNNIIGGFPFPPQGISFFRSQVLPIICNPKVDLFGVCRLLFYLRGSVPDYIKREQTPSILGHLYAPNCLKVLLQFWQMSIADRFCHYDHGVSKNMQIYGQATPPDYDLNLVTVPTSLFLGINDLIANKKATDRLAQALPNLVDYYTVPYEKYTHISFSYDNDANHLVFNHTLKLLNQFSS